MREILFRGKRVDDKDWWEYGYYCETNNQTLHKYLIVPNFASVCYGIDVIPETVGQYTGLTDRNDVKIFEGDIVRYLDEYYTVQRECDVLGGYWAETGYILDHIGWNDYIHFTDTIDAYSNECQIFVVGNLHDNPELLLK